MVSSIKGAWLKLGVTILTLGHAPPPGVCGGKHDDEMVQGHPVLPSGAEGNSSILGQRMVFYLVGHAMNQTLRRKGRYSDLYSRKDGNSFQWLEVCYFLIMQSTSK